MRYRLIVECAPGGPEYRWGFEYLPGDLCKAVAQAQEIAKRREIRWKTAEVLSKKEEDSFWCVCWQDSNSAMVQLLGDSHI